MKSPDDDMKALFIPRVVSDEETELRAWYKLNEQRLAGRGHLEIIRYALMNRFTPSLVFEVFSNLEDVKRGTCADDRFRLHLWQFKEHLEQIATMKRDKILDLSPLWRELHEFQTGETKMEEKSQ